MWPGPLVRVMEGFSLKFFIYGSNMDLAQMHERCRELSLSSFVADAHGWRLCFPRRSDRRKGGVGSLAEDQSASVWGVVFTVAERDLARIIREGSPCSNFISTDRLEYTRKHWCGTSRRRLVKLQRQGEAAGGDCE